MLFKLFLENSGYIQAHDSLENLGTKEYMIQSGFITLGKGEIGNSGCYTNFYFKDRSSQLLKHSSFYDGEADE